MGQDVSVILVTASTKLQMEYMSGRQERAEWETYAMLLPDSCSTKFTGRLAWTVACANSTVPLGAPEYERNVELS